MDMQPSQANYIMAYFKQHPKQALAYDDWTDELAREYKSLTGNTARHFRSIVRRLSGEGKLLKVKNGVYMYDPDYVHNPRRDKFNRKQKRQIQERDEFRCVCCGLGKREGLTLYVDFMFPNKPNRAASTLNGATFCSRHRINSSGNSLKELLMKSLELAIALVQLEQDPKSQYGLQELSRLRHKLDLRMK